MKKPLNILMPLDLPPGRQAIDFALSLRQIVDARYLLLHVVPRGEVETFATLGGEPEDLLSRKMRQAAAELAVTAEHLQRSAIDLQVEVRVAEGVPFREICRLAEEERCDLIVIATHGRVGVSHLLLGSTAERVVKHASCPVLSFKPAQRAG